MDDVELSAEITKINFLLENLYAFIHVREGGDAHGVDSFAEEALRQFNELPVTQHGSGHGNGEAIHELASHRLEMFFAGLKRRVSNAGR